MKFIAQDIEILFDTQNRLKVILTVPGGRSIIPLLSQLKSIVEKGKHLAVEIKQYREKRSLDANSYAWVLISKIADSMIPPLPKEEVYITMLKRYGQREPKLLSVISDAVDMVYRATDNHCVEVGESELNGKLFKHIAILIGSSQYDSKQMSILIDGIVSEAKELGIDVSESEKNRIIEEWGN